MQKKLIFCKRKKKSSVRVLILFSSQILPLSGLTKPINKRQMVDFPEPDSPTKPNVSLLKS